MRSSKAGETRYQMYSRAGQLMYDESTGGERRKYYYLGSRLVGQTEGVSSQMRYLLTDRQGSVRAKTDANRVISYETVRGPYGAVRLGGKQSVRRWRDTWKTQSAA
ncbi:MAG: hypothetical protein IPO08_04205 [Xanthomonadales bacterium]|nr:hypothetical protein [Xanthomonadales bacterium]